MRKIEMASVRERRKRRNQVIIGILLIVLMIASTVGFAFSNHLFNGGGDSQGSLGDASLGSYAYKGITYTDVNGYWTFESNDGQYATRYGPWEVEDVEISNGLRVQHYARQPLYFVGSPQDATYEITRNFAGFVVRSQEACLDTEGCPENVPVKSCDDSNMVIIETVDEGELETVYQEEGCVYILASSANQVKFADAFVFSVLGIE